MGAFLEMFDVLLNGEPANVQEIRYFRPAAPGSIAVLTMDEMLKKILSRETMAKYIALCAPMELGAIKKKGPGISAGPNV